MNTEDRIRQHLQVEAEQLRAPDGSVDAAVRRGSRRRAARFAAGSTLAVALVAGAGIVAAIANAGNSTPDSDRIIATASQEETNGASPTTTPGSGVAIAAVEYEWEQIVLPGSQTQYGPPPLVAERDETFIAAISGEGAEPTTSLYSSTDGRNWTPVAEVQIEFVELLAATERGFIAAGHGFSEAGHPALRIATSPNGLDWTFANIPLDTSSGLSVTQATGSPDQYVIAGTVWDDPGVPPVDLPEAGVVLQEIGPELRVLDGTSGELLFQVSNQVVYGGEGLAVYDPATGEAVVAFTSEELDAAYATGKNPVTLSRGDYTVELRDDDVFVAIDSSTGRVIEGSQADLYRPPRLIIANPETGDVVVDMPWEEWEEARSRAYEDFVYDEPESVTHVYTSGDGLEWTRRDLDLDGEWIGTSVNGLAYSSGRFIAFVDAWNYNNGTLFVLHSSDGLEWEVAEPDIASITGVVAWEGGFAAISYGNRGPRLVTSDDGLAWRVGPALNREVGLHGVWASDDAVVAFGTLSPGNVEPVVETTVEGRTLRLDPGLGLITVTDEASAQVLARIEFDPYAEEPPPGIELTLNGFVIRNAEGEVVMELDATDLERAYESVSEQFEGFFEQLPAIFLFDGERWMQASTSDLLMSYPRSLAIGSGGNLVVTGEGIVVSEFSESGGSSTVIERPVGEWASIWLGTPAG